MCRPTDVMPVTGSTVRSRYSLASDGPAAKPDQSWISFGGFAQRAELDFACSDQRVFKYCHFIERNAVNAIEFVDIDDMLVCFRLH